MRCARLCRRGIGLGIGVGREGLRRLNAAYCLLVCLLSVLAGTTVPSLAESRPKAFGVTVVDGMSIRQVGDATHVRLRMTRHLVPTIFTLPNPYRVILDLPNATFRLPASAGRQGKGLVSAYRYGLLTPLSARMVIDTAGAFAISTVRIVDSTDDRADLFIELKAIPHSQFRRQGRQTQRPAGSDLRKAQFDVGPSGPGRQPVIVIDPGHGGPDPGAVGGRNTYEKGIALAVGKALRRSLTARRRYKVVMTRTRDIFVSLEDRVRLSRAVGASLFLSLHADATERAAEEVRGASIYTLSSRASDAEAHRFAKNENASDVLAGFPIISDASAGSVETILIDLLKRETERFSRRFREDLVKSMGRVAVLSHDPRRAAAFVVLKQTEIPSVLIELGYISNPRDEREMLNPTWQNKVAEAIARAVDIYFGQTVSGRQ